MNIAYIIAYAYINEMPNVILCSYWTRKRPNITRFPEIDIEGKEGKKISHTGKTVSNLPVLPLKC